ncbi:MAG: diguanylate cyclase, partial [Bacteroidetes bacterium RIFOXYA12_FULL_33_9]
MADLSTKYLGLNLKNPIVVGSSGLSGTVEGVKKLAENGAGAVVLKSLFEEQIIFEEIEMLNKDKSIDAYPEAADYIRNYTKENSIKNYLTLIEESKKAVSIPIIASINCTSAGEWIGFAKRIEKAGADALELNVFILPSDENKSGEENEKVYFDILEKIKKEVKLPISLKMSSYSAGLTQLIQKISWSKNVDGIVMFNRSYSPDIDIDNLKVVSSNVFSSPEDITTSLRWVAIMSDRIKINIAASTGIHDGKGVIKQILAGATVVQIASTLYKNGVPHLNFMLKEMNAWMDA